MKKEKLIGLSLCAVVLLVLGSLSNVVGYQSMNLTMNDSPLFATRIRRATNQQQDIIASKYLGKEMYVLTFPLRDDKTEQLKRVLERIQMMNDREIEWYTALCIQRAKQYNMNANMIIKTVHILRAHPEIITSLIQRNYQNVVISNSFITSWSFCGLFLELFLLFLFVLFIMIVNPDYTSDCGSPS